MTRYERIETGFLITPIDIDKICREVTQSGRESGELESNQRYKVRGGEGVFLHYKPETRSHFDADIYWLDTEGVLVTEPISKEKPILLDVYRVTDMGEGKSTTSILPTKTVELVPSGTFHEYLQPEGVPLEDFVRRFGARLEGNFWGIVKFLKGLGYPIGEEE